MESSPLLSVFALAAAFLSGSIPFALLMGRLKGLDVRQHGSGNIGATNAIRVLGKGPGIACLGLDVAKGWLPASLFSGISGFGWDLSPSFLSALDWGLIVGIAAVLGHVFSPWVGWRGGKGVATSLGAFLAVAPIPVLICLVIGVVLIFTTGYMSLASLTGATLLPILIFALSDAESRPWMIIVLSSAVALFIIWRHRENVGRLLHGNENKIIGAKSPPPESEQAEDS